MAEQMGMPLTLDTGNGQTISPISTLIVTKAMDAEGDIVYGIAMSDGMDIMDALALAQYAIIDINERVKAIVAP